MKFYILIFLVLTNTNANLNQESFLQFNEDMLHKSPVKTCQNPGFYVTQANIEESKPENHDKIILYHGETYGAWLFQLILKEFKFPEAPEDWLPLRYGLLKEDIDRTDLMKLIYPKHVDSTPAYIELGLSVSPNLVANDMTESAWYFICARYHGHWHKISGLSVKYRDTSLHSQLYGMIKQEFIHEDNWDKFKRQKKVLYKFIQVIREQEQNYNADSLLSEIQNFYPYTFDKFHSYLKFLPFILNKQKNAEGVALQIIMDKEIADKLTYSSYPFGYVESKKHEKFEERLPWTGEDIEPYSEFYEGVKNKKDFNQARLAMNNDFRTFPSRVRIKSIAGIMGNPTDYKILKSMIKEMVEANKK